VDSTKLLLGGPARKILTGKKEPITHRRPNPIKIWGDLGRAEGKLHGHGEEGMKSLIT